jgi:hypothetical protein
MWLSELKTALPAFLDHQCDKTTPGYFSYSLSGDLFETKLDSNLAGSIFALKLYYMLGEQGKKNTQPIIDRILSFQDQNGMFRDPYVYRKRFLRTVLSDMKRGRFVDFKNKQYVHAETRQVYSALLLYDVLPKHISLKIPTMPDEIKKFLKKLDWSLPWGAGSHFSHLLFFLSLLHRVGQLDNQNFSNARQTATDFVSSLQHETDGAWYRGHPSHRQKINGAMKVITGFVVDDLPFPYPEKLIDLCLIQPPHESADACDQINQVLVLHHANKFCKYSYRRDEIKRFCFETLQAWREYYYPELGGFSFHKHQANDRYYGAKVSRGLDEPDIHGTTMFIWGLTMIRHLIQIDELNFLHEIKS